MQKNVEKFRNMQRNAEIFREMQRNAEKCREMQRNVEKVREMQIYAYSLFREMQRERVLFGANKKILLLNRSMFQ